jgi:hypothetical protein
VAVWQCQQQENIMLKPCGVDASVLGFIWAAECPLFKSELGDYIRQRPVLMNYLAEMQQRYFPEYSV